jgi:modification methylase
METSSKESHVVNGTSELLPFKSEVVSLSVTSPPYHNAIDYGKHVSKNGAWYRGNSDIRLESYMAQMTSAFDEVYRVTKDGGFCAIVIGNELNRGDIIPLPHLLATALATGSGKWIFHEEIVWNKVTGGLDRFGVTIQRPFPTYYRANIMHEQILILRKGNLNRTKRSDSRFTIDDVMKKDVSNSVWNIAPVPPRYIDHPCPFPEEIPYRLIKLYSNRGDYVLDPFMGSGQTGKAARYLERAFLGVELQKKYCQLAARRIQNEGLHLRAQLVARWEKLNQE